MTYKLIIDQKFSYWHAKVTGENTVENVKGYMEEIVNKCSDAKCPYLLIEEQLEGPRLNSFKVYEIASEGSAHAYGLFNAIAYVDVNAEGVLMQFAENVAANRDLPVKVFETVAEAEKWLIEQHKRRA